MTAIHEVCSCGATFDFTPRSGAFGESECRKSAKEWREQHRHEVPTPVVTELVQGWEAVLVRCAECDAPTEPCADKVDA